MCGIFGVVSSYYPSDYLHSIYKELRQQNLERGNRGEGHLFVERDKAISVRAVYCDENLSEFPLNTNRNNLIGIFGHVRAPTGDTVDDLECVHPFEYPDRYFAHNGIILNHEKLKEKFGPNKKGVPSVDSYVLGYLIGTNLWHRLKYVEGQYACWQVSLNPVRIHLFRVAAPLYISQQHSLMIFSSVRIPNMEMQQLDEGYVYRFGPDGSMTNKPIKFDFYRHY